MVRSPRKTKGKPRKTVRKNESVGGRRDTVTPRDDLILAALYFCRYLSTTLIAQMFFNSKSAARRRLSQLALKGYIDARNMFFAMPEWETLGKCENVWHLTKKGFDTATESLGLREEHYVPKQLGQAGSIHHVQTAEVYVAAKESLDENVGPYPAWEWKHERKAHEEFERANESLGHQPDAHVLFHGHTFVIERQTRESRIDSRKVDEKVKGHAIWSRVRADDPETVEVLFACDDDRVAEAAVRAGERYGVEVYAGDVGKVAHYLYQSAQRLKP
jgi:hypothetical protein